MALLVVAFSLGTRPPPPHQLNTADAYRAIYGSDYSSQLMTNASRLYRQRRLTEALALYQEGYRDACHRRHPLAAFWFLIGRAGAHYAALDYRMALDDYLAARDTALAAGLQSQAAIALSNLSSLYFHSFDTTSALAAAEDANRMLPVGARPNERTQVLAQLGRVLLARGEGDRAVSIFKEAIEIAARSNDAATESLAWDQMGAALIQSGKIQSAERALDNALRLRRLGNDRNLFATEYKLGLVYLRKGDLKSARRLVNSAFTKRDPLQIPSHHFYLARAQILRAEGDLRAALGDYISAIKAADEWRSRGLFADQFRISADILLSDICDGAIDTAVALFRQTNDQQYAVLSWQIDEHIRSASLRESVRQGGTWTASVSPEYWQMLDRLHELQAGRFSDQDNAGASNSAELIRLRMHLAEMEAHAGADELQNTTGYTASSNETKSVSYGTQGKNTESFSPGISLKDIRRILSKSRTLISFHVGESLYRWAITGGRLELKVVANLPAADIVALRASILKGSDEAHLRGERIFSDLFSGIMENGTTGWSIALDGDLFDVPLAALVCARRHGRPVHLAESRTVELVPGAWALSSPGGLAGKTSGFVGIGDGIYNLADPRYSTIAHNTSNWSVPVLVRDPVIPIQFARLVQSQEEVVQCARAAGGRATILLGANAHRKNLISALAGNPAFIHIAAHFLTLPDGDKTTAIALGLRPGPNGAPGWDLLTADDIRSLRVPGAVVVMSGCSSAAGRAVPASGLLGLARAWLEAGAKAVIATQWPVPDDSGKLFLKFYDHLRNSDRGDRLAPAEALRRAQVEALRSSGSESEPLYWAAYEIFGRSNER